jgi:hypothetical protein
VDRFIGSFWLQQQVVAFYRFTIGEPWKINSDIGDDKLN